MMAKKNKNSILADNVASAEKTADAIEENRQTQDTESAQVTDSTKSLEIEDMALYKLNDYIEEIEKLKAENSQLIEKNNQLLIRLNELSYNTTQNSQAKLQPYQTKVQFNDIEKQKSDTNEEKSKKTTNLRQRRYVSYNSYRNNGYGTWN